jgi:hypothetical protein
MNKILRSVTLCSLVAAAAAACGGQEQTAPQPGTPGAPQPQQNAQQRLPLGAAPVFSQRNVPPPNAFNHPGFVYYTAGAPPPPAAPVYAMPPAHSRVEALNMNHLQKSAQQRSGCNVAREVADGVFVHVDCYPYRRIPIAVKHASPAKLAMMTRGHVRWNPQAAHMIAPHMSGPGGGVIRGGAPSGAIMAAGPPGGGASTSADAPQAYPDAVDHRLNGTEGPIKDQGDVGACTAFALSAVMDNSLRRAGQNLTTSPEHLWAHYGIPTMEDAATANVNKGITTFDAWPYSGREACELTRDGTDDCGAAYSVLPNTASRDTALQQHYTAAEAANGHKVIAFEELSVAPVNLDEIVTTLASGADLWVAFHIDSSVWTNRAMQNFVLPDWSTPDGGHAVALAGYRNTPSGKQFLIHNSWGPKWGDAGYAWVSQAMVQKWLHLAYKIRTDADSGTPPVTPPVTPTPNAPNVTPPAPSPTPPAKPKTDEDCPGDQVMDSVTGTCAGICSDQSRPANGQCPNGPAPQPQPGALALPGWPGGFPTIPGMPAIPGWPAAPAPNGPAPSPSAQPAPNGPAPAPSSQPGAPQSPFPWPAPWPMPSAMPSSFPQFFPPPPAPSK